VTLNGATYTVPLRVTTENFSDEYEYRKAGVTDEYRKAGVTV